MPLNMDRATLWGCGGGMVFEDEHSWDVRDRMEYVAASIRKVQAAALSAMAAAGDALVFFNPLNWERNDPVFLELPEGRSLEKAACQATPDGKTLCCVTLPSMGATGVVLQSRGPETSQEVEPPPSIETRHYSAQMDWKTGALVSVKLKPSGREMLGGASNVIVAEKPKPQQDDYGDMMSWRPQRTRLASSGDFSPAISVSTGTLVTTVEITSEFYGGSPSRRVMRFYKDFPRIDFETEVQDIPDITVVVSEFVLARDIEAVRRGVPCGFSHGAWSKPNPNLSGWTKGILPAVRWTDYSLVGGGGVAILDRGLSGRELNGRTPILYLLNATDKYYEYPNAWLSGKGRHSYEYALVAHEGTWEAARIPHRAWEYNCPPVVGAGREALAAKSFLQTSDNVIVEVVRREGAEIEVRLVECLGVPGAAEVTLNLPHRGAALTDLRGRRPQPLAGDGPTYRFPVRPQQIVTIHFHAASAVSSLVPVTAWDKFVPETKRAALHAYGPYKGHPPRGNEPQT